jgi:hypothetical protein
MNEYPITFEAEGHPTIVVFEDMISIKAIDYSNFRDFKWSEIKSIKFHRPYENSLLGLLYEIHSFWRKYRAEDNYVLKIKLKDGEHWADDTTPKYDSAFIDLVEKLQSNRKSSAIDLCNQPQHGD